MTEEELITVELVVDEWADDNGPLPAPVVYRLIAEVRRLRAIDPCDGAGCEVVAAFRDEMYSRQAHIEELKNELKQICQARILDHEAKLGLKRAK